MPYNDLFLNEPVQEGTRGTENTGSLTKWAVIVPVSLLLFAALSFLVLVPCLPLKTIEITGAEQLSSGQILKAAGLNEKTSFVSLRSTLIKRNIESLAEVESVSVTRRFPDSLHIDLVMRKQLAVAFTSHEGRTIPVSIDRNGVVFRIGRSAASDLSAGPVISGLLFDNPYPGIQLPPFLSPLINDISRLRKECPALLDTISEIRIVKKGYDAYELVLYPSHKPVRVKIGSQLNEDILRYMMLLLDVMASAGISTDELDFRSGTAAYQVKEG